MTLGLLVGRFGSLVLEQMPPQQIVIPDESFPAQLLRLRSAFGHHLIPLALLARADGDYAEIEQKAILDHCLALAGDADMAVEAGERETLKAYIAEFRPTFAQLDPALKRIEKESAENLAALITTAKAVVDADRGRRQEEVNLLTEIEDELKAL